jgi:hypothetical protein
MPGLDGTGPAGPRGVGRGMGRCMGAGRGTGMGRGGCRQGAMAYSSAEQGDKGALEARLAALENEAKEIRKLLSEKTGKKGK